MKTPVPESIFTFSTRSSGRSLLLLLAGLAGLLAGCETPQSRPEFSPIEFEAIEALQNRRASAFQVLESTGTIELRRTEEGSTSFDSCALNLWRDQANFALRLRKFGERFLWVGSNGTDWWVFELASEPTRLVVLPLGEEGGLNLGTEESLLGPRKLLQLSGLLPIDPEARCEQLHLTEEGLISFVLATEVKGGWNRMRWEVDRKRLLPSQIEALDEQGDVLFRARLDAYEPIPARDLPIGAWPQFARKVFINDTSGQTDVRIFFNNPNARGTRIKPRLFDLQELLGAFKPSKVEYLAE